MGETVIAGAKVTELFGVDISGIDPAVSVALTEAVLAQAEKSQPIETGRRVIITWPAPTTSGVLPIYSVTITDADSGEQILTGVKLSLVLGTDTGFEGDIIEADITALADEDGNLLGAGKQPVRADAVQRDVAESFTPEEWEERQRATAAAPFAFRTGVFRFAVAEMKVAD